MERKGKPLDNVDGDTDESVDWEDFIVVSGGKSLLQLSRGDCHFLQLEETKDVVLPEQERHQCS